MNKLLSINEVKQMSRKDLIYALEWIDPDGIYNDEDSAREFGEVMTRDEAERLVINQFEL